MRGGGGALLCSVQLEGERVKLKMFFSVYFVWWVARVRILRRTRISLPRRRRGGIFSLAGKGHVRILIIHRYIRFEGGKNRPEEAGCADYAQGGWDPV